MMRGTINILIKNLLICYFVSTIEPIFSQNILHERIYVHTDKNYYQTGEIIWFRIYYNTNAEKFTPTVISKLAYVEIIDSVNRPVLQCKIRLGDGSGNGSFMLPASLSTGTYILRSYTNWMKNFGPEHYFGKEIAIVNAANGHKSYKLSDLNMPVIAGSMPVQVKTDNQQYGQRKKVKLSVSASPSADISISVYKIDSLVSEDPVNISSILNKDQNINEPEHFAHPPEYNGHFINGRMISRNTRM